METMLAEKIKLIRLQQNNQNVLKCHIFSQKKNISVSLPQSEKKCERK